MEFGKRIVGQEEVIDELLIALFSQGHCLLVGVPGLAKTLLINSLAEILNLQFNRIQFTPDPHAVRYHWNGYYSGGHRQRQPVFQIYKRSGILKHSSCRTKLTERLPKRKPHYCRSMQEYKVSAGGVTYPLDLPFFVLATQNPIEQEGTYPLPEAQLDRFMFNIYVDYPDSAAEKQIVMRTTSAYDPSLQPVIAGEDIIRLQKIVRKVPIAESMVEYAVALSRVSRPNNPDAPDFIRDWVNWGAGPRASQYLVLGAKARAIMHGRYHVAYTDIKAVAKPVLRHRILTNFNAEADGITSP